MSVERMLIRYGTDRTKGCVSRSTLFGLVYRLAISAETRWHRLRGFERLSELVTGAKFVDGVCAQVRTQKNRSAQQRRRLINQPYTRFDDSSADPL